MNWAHLHVARNRKAKKRLPYSYSPEVKWLRYGVWVLFVVALIAGVQALVALLAPYSAWSPDLPRRHCHARCRGHPGLEERTYVLQHHLPGGNHAELLLPLRHVPPGHRHGEGIDTCKFGALHYQYAWGSSSKTAQNEDGKAKSSVSSSNKAKIEDEGRRAFVTGAALAVGTAALKAQEKKVDGGFATILDKEVPARDVPITPPGSKSIKDFYRRCTACQLCVAECPNQVLRPSTDLKHFMQPEMSYERGYCRPECTRCSEVCPTGAILRIDRYIEKLRQETS